MWTAPVAHWPPWIIRITMTTVASASGISKPPLANSSSCALPTSPLKRAWCAWMTKSPSVTSWAHWVCGSVCVCTVCVSECAVCAWVQVKVNVSNLSNGSCFGNLQYMPMHLHMCVRVCVWVCVFMYLFIRHPLWHRSCSWGFSVCRWDSECYLHLK